MNILDNVSEFIRVKYKIIQLQYKFTNQSCTVGMGIMLFLDVFICCLSVGASKIASLL